MTGLDAYTRRLLAEATAEAEQATETSCGFKPYCPGPDRPFVDMATCRVCHTAQLLRKIMTRIDTAPRIRGLSPENTARTDQIITYLRTDAADLPRTTGEVIDGTGMRGYDGTVLRLLNRLATLGIIEKWPASAIQMSCMWRLLTIPADQEVNT